MTISLLRKIATHGCVFALAFAGSSYVLPAQNLNIGKIRFPSPPPRPKVGKDVVAVLKESGKYSTFLKLADQAGLMPLLHGTERDSTPADVTFREIPIDPLTPEQLQIEGLPPGMDPEAIRAQITDAIQQQRVGSELLPGQITVFAPTDSAFSKLSKSTRDSLQSSPNALRKFLLGHLVNTGIEEGSIAAVKEMQTMGGTTLPVTPVVAGATKVAEAKIVQTTYGDNGLIYGIASVLRR